MKIARILLFILFACMPLQAIADLQEQEKECKKSKKRGVAEAALFLIGISGLCGWGYTLYWWKNNGPTASKQGDQSDSVPLTSEQFIAQEIKKESYKDMRFSNHDIVEILDFASHVDLAQQMATMKTIKVKDKENQKATIAKGTIALALQEWRKNKNKTQRT